MRHTARSTGHAVRYGSHRLRRFAAVPEHLDPPSASGSSNSTWSCAPAMRSAIVRVRDRAGAARRRRHQARERMGRSPRPFRARADDRTHRMPARRRSACITLLGTGLAAIDGVSDGSGGSRRTRIPACTTTEKESDLCPDPATSRTSCCGWATRRRRSTIPDDRAGTRRDRPRDQRVQPGERPRRQQTARLEKGLPCAAVMFS